MKKNIELSGGPVVPFLWLEVNSFDQRGFQCDGEVMERLQDSDEGIDSGAVSEQGCVLVHPQDHWALHQQGEPLGQQTVSARQTVEVSTSVAGSCVVSYFCTYEALLFIHHVNEHEQ